MRTLFFNRFRGGMPKFRTILKRKSTQTKCQITFMDCKDDTKHVNNATNNQSFITFCYWSTPIFVVTWKYFHDTKNTQ